MSEPAHYEREITDFAHQIRRHAAASPGAYFCSGRKNLVTDCCRAEFALEPLLEFFTIAAIRQKILAVGMRLAAAPYYYCKGQ